MCASCGHHRERLQERDDGTLVAEDLLPRQRAQQERDEERRDHHGEREGLPEWVAPQLDPDEVRQRVAEEQGQDGRDRGVGERADDVRQVRLHDRDVVLPLERVVVLADVAELAGRLEARQDQGDERHQEEQAEIERSRQQQEERDRAAPAGRRLGRDRCRCREGAERHLRLPRARLRDARDAGWRSAMCPRRVRSAVLSPGRRRVRRCGRRSRSARPRRRR